MLSKNDIKFVRSLALAKFRKRHGLFLAEGSKVINEFISCGWEFEHLYALSENALNASEFKVISEKELGRISEMTTPQDSLAVIKFRSTDLQGFPDFIIACDRIQDPGNLGTIIRTADWFGAEAVICSEDCAEAFSPKVVQASMGSLARVKVVRTDLHAFLTKVKSSADHVIYTASLEGDDLYGSEMPERSVIILGNESQGVSADISRMAEKEIRIPGGEHTESLNVAVSAGILMAEYFRLNPRK